MSQLVRVQNFCVSRDGFGAGEHQSLDAPFGVSAPIDGHTAQLPKDIVSWMFATASSPVGNTSDGSRGLDDYFTRDFSNNIGAEIMGRNKFTPFRGAWEDQDWQGWWGDNPPFHTPVFVLTHYPRPSLSLGATTFHFVDATPADALQLAMESADGKDVRIGGGVSTVRAFLEADLIDTMHVAVSPVVIGRGERLWQSPDELLDRFQLETIPSPSGVTHLLFWRR